MAKKKTEEGMSAELRSIADNNVANTKLQIRTGITFRQPRIDEIIKCEELYYNRKQKALRGRFNFPIPVMSGFVDTLLSKIDDEMVINFESTKLSNKIIFKKIEAAWKDDSAPTKGAWAMKDLLAKKTAIFSGRAIYEIYATQDEGGYKSCFDLVDTFDFIAEPDGGGVSLDNHIFQGRLNIFRTKEELEAGVKAGYYDALQVQKVITTTGVKEFKENWDLYQNKEKRYNALHLNISNNNYVGVPLYRFAALRQLINGTYYYNFCEANTCEWIRFDTTKNVYGTDKSCWVSWATHPDAFNFWSKASVDDVRPIAEALKTIINFMFDEAQKRLWGQRYFDPLMVPDPSQLEWDRPDKIIEMIVPQGKNISDGVYQAQLGDNTQVTINLIDYFRNFLKTESGVTDNTQGEEDTQTLGIGQINMGQVADRFGLINKFYRHAWAELGERYVIGLKMYMTDKKLIKMIGDKGTEWAELKADELEFDEFPAIRISGGSAELEMDQKKQEAEAAALMDVIQNMPDVLNKKVAATERLRIGQWEPDRIAAILDVSSDGNEDETVRAAQAVEKIIAGKKNVPVFQGATTRFVNWIVNYARMEIDDKRDQFNLLSYANKHRAVVARNMQEKAQADANTIARKNAGIGSGTGNSAGVPALNAPISSPALPASIPPQNPQGPQNGALPSQIQPNNLNPGNHVVTQ